MIFFCETVMALCVSQYKVNLRQGPSTKYPISWTVGKYTPLIKVKQKGKWVQVSDQDGQKHWALRSLLTNTIQCMSIRVKKSNIRTGPGANYKQAPWLQADLYTPLKRIGKEGDWFKVEDAFRNQFWVHKNTVWRPITSVSFSF